MECGSGSWKDEFTYVTVEVPHSDDEVTIKLEGNLNQHSKDESFGFANFRLYALKNGGSVPKGPEGENIDFPELTNNSFGPEDVLGW